VKYHKLSANVRRVGVLGGTFDPVHYGHLVVAEEVYVTLQLTEMVLCPSGQPPHKRMQRSQKQSIVWKCYELAIASNPHFTVSRVDH